MCPVGARGLWALLWGLSLISWTEVAASPSNSPAPPAHRKPLYSFGRSFLGLDKCNACAGTSICKKFFKEEIRFERWLSPRLQLPLTYKNSYQGNYTDDSESWRPVFISRMMPHHKHEASDLKICSSAGQRHSCSIEGVLRNTKRFQSWVLSSLLTPHMVQGLTSPMLRCTSQRLLDRIVRRYAEVSDAGSVQMKHFAERDKLRLLYTLSVNQHPLMLQIFPGSEGWPFPKYYGSCGRVIVTTSTNPIKQFYSAAFEARADVAYQLLSITQSLRTNGFNYVLYYTSVSEDMFGTFEDGRLFITDASTIGVIDKQEGFLDGAVQQENYTDVFSCLNLNCRRPPPCRTVRDAQSVLLICRDILPKLLISNDNPTGSRQKDISSLLHICADRTLLDRSIIKAANTLMSLLRPLRPCNQHFSYRYPECRYGSEF
ncbi:divergent protein kinase domain 2B [Lepisosteus oculatus]|uniref:Divergent protein kinase domain 2B n=1 Tax=Lepisosteus oculatus TaxID=7918 RepID=W5M112_LEPOC|nr:PREDICTED: deleted in autism-related protein 1 [Lepisosteus oculatus]